MITITEYIEGIFRDFKNYLDSIPRMCKLKDMSFKSGNIPDYTDVNIQQLYLLRFAYAYAFEYRAMYLKLFETYNNFDNISVTSIGCGTGIDYWSLVAALEKIGNKTCKVRYKGIDIIDWYHKFHMRTNDAVKFWCCDAVESFINAKRLIQDIYFFPKSISEFSNEDFASICQCFTEKLIEKDILHILVSLRAEDYNRPVLKLDKKEKI